MNVVSLGIRTILTYVRESGTALSAMLGRGKRTPHASWCVELRCGWRIDTPLTPHVHPPPTHTNRHLLHTSSTPLQVWQLESVSLLRKYSGLVDVIWSMLLARPLQQAVAVSSNPFVSYRAMQAHHSQFVWFRHLFVIFSRYTFINTLVPMQADPAMRTKAA
jgi:hypothetical protein